MRKVLKQVLLPAALLFLCSVLLFAAVGAVITGTMPPWQDCIGEETAAEKITGRYLLEQSSAQEDNLIIFGSSELRTTEISTHPVNFFAGKRCGFQVDLIGRGSCQSIIHAIQIAASGDSLTGKKVVLITSPQSYVPGGIAPDLFMANFSPQQYLELLADPDLTDGVKREISARVAELFAEYEALPDAAAADPALRWKAEHLQTPGLASSFRDSALTPYYVFSGYLYALKDKISARKLLESARGPLPAAGTAEIDWATEEKSAVDAARAMTANNNFGMLDDYYTTYIGSRLERQQGRDAALDYSESEEYGDLRLLFEVCAQKGVEPLFIHVPLHGAWSDYTGFPADRRQKYYDNVRSIAEEYGIEMLDLTGYEHEEYFMCDVMHLGWKGWLEVDKALVKFFNR